MRLILIGPPGSGKGTQAKLLSQRQSLRHISTGDVLREAIRAQTPAGQRAQPFVVSGKLVPDDLVNEMVADLFQAEHPDRFIMDGYPRTPAQAQAFDDVLRRHHLPLTGVIWLQVGDEEIVKRLSGRWNCPQCKATFHTSFKPPRVAGKCDDCGHDLVQRDDDKEATVRQRLALYHQHATRLADHYRARGLIREVSGVGDVEAIYANITRLL